MAKDADITDDEVKELEDCSTNINAVVKESQQAKATAKSVVALIAYVFLLLVYSLAKRTYIQGERRSSTGNLRPAKNLVKLFTFALKLSNEKLNWNGFKFYWSQLVPTFISGDLGFQGKSK